MKQYFRLVDDIMVPKRWHLGVLALADGTEPRLRAGIRYELTETPSIPVTHEGRVLEFTLTSFAVPIVTPKLARVIAATSGADVQCLPVDIVGHPGMMALNAVRVIRCLDETRSEFIKWTKQDHRADLAGQYRQIMRLVLDRATIPPDVNVFRIWGSLIELVVSDTVKEAMERVGCFGAKFIELQT